MTTVKSLILAAGILAATHCLAEPPAPITLQNVLWQNLPDEVRFTPAPATHNFESMLRAGRDIFGTVWTAFSERTDETENSYHEQARSASRLTEDGVVAEVTGLGWAQLADRNGNLWFGNNLKTSRAAFQVWNEGLPLCLVTIPDGQGPTFLLSDQPGSVYALTMAGLMHYTVAPGAPPNHYELRHTYTLENMEGTPERFFYSATTGKLVVQTAARREGNTIEYYLYLVRLPADGK